MSRRRKPILSPPLVPELRPGPPGGARDRNRQRRVEQLSAAALALFLERGLSEVTVDDIVARAGVAKGSFYRYFTDKEALVEALLLPAASELRAAVATCQQTLLTPGSSSAGAFLVMAQELALLVTRHTDVIRLYLQESRGPAVGARRSIRRLADEVAARAVELGRASRRMDEFVDLDPHVVTLTIIGAAERLLFAHLCTRPFPDPIKVALTLVSIIDDGMRLRTPR